MDLTGGVILFLILLPAFGIGWIGGMLHMRKNYLGLLRRLDVSNRMAIRHAGQQAREQRYLGYAVGYREGRRSG